jgi:hypothetical protein
LGTARLWLLLLCGLACGDRVVVARGLSLVSAARSSDDAGIGQPEAQDAAADATDGAVPKPVDAGHGSTGRHPPPPPPPSPHGNPQSDPHSNPQADPHDKDVQADPAEAADVGADTGEQDAGHDSALKRH